MKKLIIVLIVLLVSNAYAHAHDDGSFYVIPTGKVITKEVCNGTPVGSNAFALSEDRPLMYVGDVFTTTKGYLIQITGIHNGDWSGYRYRVRYDEGSFRIAPATLPQPDEGAKGPYYYLNNGGIAYARYL